MKKMKKVLSLILTVIMVLAMAAPAMAADTYTITITNPSEGHTYKAYQIFAGNLDAVDGKDTLTNIEWGTDVDGTELLADLKLEEFETIDFSPEPDTVVSAADVAKVLGNITQDDHADIQKFARIASDYLKNDNTVPSGNNAIVVTAPGYYLIKDTSNNASDVISSIILEVVKDVEISPKVVNTPTPDKEIVNEDGETIEDDGRDYEVGDEIYFELSATLPSGTAFNDYETYKLEFEDTLSAGLTYNEIVKVSIGNNEITGYDWDYNAIGEDGQVVENPVEGTVYRHKLVVTINNVKADPINATGGETITVLYKAELNENAVIGSTGNENRVDLNFSNDPNGTGTGTVPGPTVKVYTFTVDINKVDKDTQARLDNAKFKLYSDEDCTVEVKVSQVGETATYIVDPDASTGDTIVSSATENIVIKGLNQGTYYLKETEAPAGYNRLEDPVKIVITPTYDDDGDMTGLTGSVENTISTSTTPGNGTVSGKIENGTGATLPSTGGIGTTIFYAAGIVLMAGAVFFVVRRKRA